MESKRMYPSFVHRTSPPKSTSLTERGYLSAKESFVPSIETQRICSYFNAEFRGFKAKKVAVDLSGIQKRAKKTERIQGRLTSRIFEDFDSESTFIRNNDWLDQNNKRTDTIKIRRIEEEEQNEYTFSSFTSRLTTSRPAGIKPNRLKQNNSYVNLYRDKLIYNSLYKHKF